MSIVPPSHGGGLNPSDSYERIAQRIKLRQDSASNWAKNDPVLASGEFGYELGYPTGKLKIGTGSTRWSELPYLMARGPQGAAGQPGPPGDQGPPGPPHPVIISTVPPPPQSVVGALWIDPTGNPDLLALLASAAGIEISSFAPADSGSLWLDTAGLQIRGARRREVHFGPQPPENDWLLWVDLSNLSGVFPFAVNPTAPSTSFVWIKV